MNAEDMREMLSSDVAFVPRRFGGVVRSVCCPSFIIFAHILCQCRCTLLSTDPSANLGWLSNDLHHSCSVSSCFKLLLW